VSSPTPVGEWPDWYLLRVTSALASLIQQEVSDDQMLRAWHAYCVAAPAPEVDQ
jgi:hypothetical protein